VKVRNSNSYWEAKPLKVHSQFHKYERTGSAFFMCACIYKVFCQTESNKNTQKNERANKQNKHVTIAIAKTHTVNTDLSMDMDGLLFNDQCNRVSSSTKDIKDAESTFGGSSVMTVPTLSDKPRFINATTFSTSEWFISKSISIKSPSTKPLLG
jgi:hypothetical protein